MAYYLRKGLVTRGVAIGIIDTFEMIQVECNAGEHGVVPSGPVERRLSVGQERSWRRRSGQKVDRCQLPQLKFVDNETRQVLETIKLSLWVWAPPGELRRCGGTLRAAS
jgi:hypothetical protein